MSIVFELGISSATAVELHPEYNFIDSKVQIKNQSRTKSGKLFLYKWSDYKRFNINVDFMPTSVGATVNSWWESNTELLLFITSDSATEVHSVMILNKDTPLKQFAKPYADRYKGRILLESY